MPWAPRDARTKTHKADTPRKQRQWAHVANEELKRTGDDAIAIRAANGVVGRSYNKSSRRDYAKNR